MFSKSVFYTVNWSFQCSVKLVFKWLIRPCHWVFLNSLAYSTCQLEMLVHILEGKVNIFISHTNFPVFPSMPMYAFQSYFDKLYHYQDVLFQNVYQISNSGIESSFISRDLCTEALLFNPFWFIFLVKI